MASSIASSTFIAADGAGYEQLMGRWSRRLAPLFVQFSEIQSGGHILDVGCGTGVLSKELAKSPSIKAITGVDYSPIYVEYSKSHVVDKRITFETGDASALRFADNTFDHTAALLVLAFVGKPMDAVHEMVRVTKPGGTVASAMWDFRGGAVFARLFWDTAAVIDPDAAERRKKAYIRPMTRPGDLANAWREGGLKDVADGMLTIRMGYANFADYWGAISGRDGPYSDYLNSLSSDDSIRLKDAVKAAFVDGEDDGPRSYAATSWVVRGKKPA